MQAALYVCVISISETEIALHYGRLERYHHSIVDGKHLMHFQRKNGILRFILISDNMFLAHPNNHEQKTITDWIVEVTENH